MTDIIIDVITTNQTIDVVRQDVTVNAGGLISNSRNGTILGQIPFWSPPDAQYIPGQISGLADNQGIRWDAANSRWENFTRLTFEDVGGVSAKIATAGSMYIQGGSFVYANETGTQFPFLVDANGKTLFQGDFGGTSSARRVEIRDATDPQLRLTHSSGVLYTDFQTNSDGNLAITPSGGYILYNNLTVAADSTSLVDDAQVVFEAGKAGIGRCNIGDNQEWAWFTFTSAGVVTLVNNSGNVVNTDTDTNLCIYDTGSGIAIKNRLESTLTLRYVVEYS